MKKGLKDGLSLNCFKRTLHSRWSQKEDERNTSVTDSEINPLTEGKEQAPAEGKAVAASGSTSSVPLEKTYMNIFT